MFTNPHNKSLLNDVMRVLSGETTETPIKPIPQWITEAAKVAASDIRSVLSEGGVVTSETRRDILRKHLSSAIEECNCSVNGETPLQFEEEVRKMERKGVEITEKAFATNNLLDEVEIEEARIGMGRKNEPLSRTLKRAAKAMKITGKAPPKPTTPPEKKEEVEDGEVDSVHEETERINEIVDGLREFVSKLSEEEVSVLRTIINENN